MSDLIKALTFGCVSMFVQIESPPNALECLIGGCFALFPHPLLWYAGYRSHNLCLDSLAGRADSERSVLSGEKLHRPL